MDNPISLDSKEFDYLCDTDFLITKHSISAKMIRLFQSTENKIKESLQEKIHLWPKQWLQKHGKISRGENYRKLPYIVLDYPRHFKDDEVFALRSMFWWGNFFSCTLHLKGSWINPLKENIISHLLANPADLFLCVNETPWEYHYGNDNYRLVRDIPQEEIKQIINDMPFIKLSRKLELSDWQRMPDFCVQSLEIFLSAI